jgi:hypothetical protein
MDWPKGQTLSFEAKADPRRGKEERWKSEDAIAPVERVGLTDVQRLKPTKPFQK